LYNIGISSLLGDFAEIPSTLGDTVLRPVAIVIEAVTAIYASSLVEVLSLPT
jgi:hypothetical protein